MGANSRAAVWGERGPNGVGLFGPASNSLPGRRLFFFCHILVKFAHCTVIRGHLCA